MWKRKIYPRYQNSLLKELDDPTNIERLELPENFAERDLIHNRLQGEFPNNEPQRGKDLADRRIAMIKSQIRSYHNAGNDIATARDMKKGCDSGALKGIKSIVVQVKQKANGLRVWRFSGISPGVLIPYSDLPSWDTDATEIIVEDDFQN
jgi:hypothetical protein